jgi:Tfp pilus assembly protein PilV
MTNSLTANFVGRQRGITLIEALIAFLVLSLGILAIARLQPELRRQAESARQRSEALRIAQADIEGQRAYAALSAASGVPSYDGIVGARFEVDGASASTVYRLTRTVDTAPPPAAKQLGVVVDWTDRDGALQQVKLASMIAGIDPALAGSLSLAPRGVAVRGAYARSAEIPLVAKDLGDGRSVFKPVAGGTGAIVFDNRSGAVIAQCNAIDAGRATQDLTASDLSACTRVNAMLLRGEIRFSAATPPSATGANDTPLPLAVSLEVEGPASPVAPWCNAEALKTVSFVRNGSRRIDAVPLAATPADFGLPAWTETGERFVAYHCVVVPPVGIARWSGRTMLVPSGGWAIGTGPAEWRVCRYSADLDGSGAIDANAEHPAIYQNVGGPLAHQNFLVVRGDQTCPAPAATHLATVQHQP